MVVGEQVPAHPSSKFPLWGVGVEAKGTQCRNGVQLLVAVGMPVLSVCCMDTIGMVRRTVRSAAAGARLVDGLQLLPGAADESLATNDQLHTLRGAFVVL